MRSLQSINRAQSEARFVSRTWGNSSSAPDVSYPVPTKAFVQSPDDIILVCVPNPNTLSGMGTVRMTRREYDAQAGGL